VPSGESRMTRLLSLIPYLVRNQGATVDEVCETFGLNRRDLLDDMQLIFLCGRPDYDPGDLMEVNIEGDRIYINMADYFSRPLRFTSQELVFLYLAGRALSDLAGLKEASTFQSALSKLREALMAEDRTVLDQVEELLAIEPEHHDQPRLQMLREAIEERRRVEMEYYSSGRDVLTKRRIDPLKLHFAGGNWYLTGWDHLSGEKRLFRVDRIRECRALRTRFNPEDYPLERPDEQPGMGAFSGRKVRLRFSPYYANWIMEQDIFSSKQMEEDGSVTCTLYAENFPWLEKELLRYGTGVEILEPPELRKAVLKRVNNLLRIYRD